MATTTLTRLPVEPQSPAVEEPLYISTGRVARLCECSSRHIYRMVQLNQFPRPIKLGSLVRFNRREVEAWLQKQSR